MRLLLLALLVVPGFTSPLVSTGSSGAIVKQPEPYVSVCSTAPLPPLVVERLATEAPVYADLGLLTQGESIHWSLRITDFLPYAADALIQVALVTQPADPGLLVGQMTSSGLAHGTIVYAEGHEVHGGSIVVYDSEKVSLFSSPYYSLGGTDIPHCLRITCESCSGTVEFLSVVR